MSRHESTTRVTVRAKANKSAEVLIYDDIGVGMFTEGVTAKDFRDTLKGFGELDQIDVRINSVGGDVHDGLAIYNTLNEHPAKVVVHIDGVALSVASVVAMAGDQIIMAENAMQMMHDPWSIVLGDADDMRSEAEVLDKFKSTLVGIYATRSDEKPETISQWMAEETWFTADEAIEAGLATEKSANKAIAASGNVPVKNFKPRYKHMPEAAKELLNPQGAPTMAADPNPNPAPQPKPAPQPDPNPPTPPPQPAPTPPPEDSAAIAERAAAAENERVTKIQALCNSAPLAADVRGAIAKRMTEDRKFTVQDAKDALYEAMCKHNAPTGGGSDPTPTGPDENAEYRKEYKAQAEIFSRMNLSEDDYIATRRVEDGKDKLLPGSSKKAAA